MVEANQSLSRMMPNRERVGRDLEFAITLAAPKDVRRVSESEE
jgi:hypothetical protein